MFSSSQKIYESMITKVKHIISSRNTQTDQDVQHEKDDWDEEQNQSLISGTSDTILEELQGAQDTTCCRRRRWTIGFTLGLFVIFCIISVPVLLHRTDHHKVWTSCGDNPATARERGCHFDLISFAWQTHECYDASLVAEFASWEPWIFWSSENGTETVSLETAFLGEQTLWLPWRYHVVHCTFVWRQLHRGYEAGWIDSDVRRYGHTTHCQRMMLMHGEETDEGRFLAIPNDRVVTLADIIYPSCEKFGEASTKSSWWDSVPSR